MTNCNVIRPLGLALILMGAVATSVGQGEEGGGRIHALPIHLNDLKKTCTFPVVLLRRPHFNEIGYWTANLPSGYWGKGSAPSQVVMIAYSHVGKNGGVLWMYEVAAQRGKSPDQLMTKIANAGIFKEHAHMEGWTMKPMVVGTTVVGPSSYVPFALDDALALLKH